MIPSDDPTYRAERARLFAAGASGTSPEISEAHLQAARRRDALELAAVDEGFGFVAGVQAAAGVYGDAADAAAYMSSLRPEPPKLTHVHRATMPTGAQVAVTITGNADQVADVVDAFTQSIDGLTRLLGELPRPRKAARR